MITRFLLAFLSFVLLGSSLHAATYTSVASGNWNSNSTWSPAGVPGAGDDVVLDRRYSVTVTANATCNSVSTLTYTCTLGCASGTLTFTINSGVTLTVAGSFNLSPPRSSYAMVFNNNGTLSVGGTFTINAVGAVTWSNVGSASVGAINFTGGSSMGITNQGGIQVSGNATFGLTGNLTINSTSSISVGSTLSMSSGAVIGFTNNGPLTVGVMTLSGGSLHTLSGSGAIAVTGAFSSTGRLNYTNTAGLTAGSFAISGGASQVSGSGAITCTGPVSITGNVDWDHTGNLSGTTFNLNPTVTTTLSHSNSLSFSGNVSINGANAAVTIDINKLTAAALTVDNNSSTPLYLTLDSLVTTGNFSTTADFTASNYFNFGYTSIGGNVSAYIGSNPGINDFQLGQFNVGGNVTAYTDWPSARNVFRVTGTGTVSGNVLLYNLDNGNAAPQNELTITGQLTVAGSTGLTLRYSNTSFNSNGPQNAISIGNAATAGTLNISQGDLNLESTMSSTYINSPDSANAIYLCQGVLTVGDSIKCSSTANAANNLIVIRDNNAFNGLTKTINLGGSVSDVTKGLLKLQDSNANADFTSYFNGSGKKQTIPASDNWNFRRIEVTNTSDTVSFGGDLGQTGSRLTARLKVNAGAVLFDNAFQYGGTGQDSIALENGGTFVISNLTGEFPLLIESVVAANGSVVNFLNNSVSTQNVLGGTSAVKNLATVYLSGTGIKEVEAPLSSGNLAIQYIRLVGGSTTFATAANTLNTVSGGQSTTNLVEVGSGATLTIPRNFNAVPQTKFLFDYTSTVAYTGANQTVYAMYANQVGAGTLAALGNLTLSGSGTKTLADSLKLYRKLSISNTILDLPSGTSLTLLSDANYTAWIGSITSTSITYGGAGASKGKIIAQRYVNLPDGNYRDFSSPITNTTLESWKNKGMLFTGFTGSNFPSFSFNNTYSYSESTDGDLNTGFTTATNITQAVHSFDGGAMVNGGWRIYGGKSSGATIMTLADEGEVYAGNQTMKVNFTHQTANRVADDGWNFVGNPYPAPIDWSSVVSANIGGVFATDSTSNGVAPSVYMYMPHDRSNPGGSLNYGAFNTVTGSKIGVSNTVIPAFQGFWLKSHHSSSNSTSYTVTLREADKFDGSVALYKSESKPDPEMAFISMTDSKGKADQVAIHYFAGARMGWDMNFDIQKFDPEPGISSLYWSTESDENLWVNAIPMDKMEYEFKLNLHHGSSGAHRIDFGSWVAFFGQDACITALDTKTGEVFNLMESPAIEIASSEPGVVRQWIVSVKKAATFGAPEVIEPTCFGDENGSIKVSLVGFDGSPSIRLIRNSEMGELTVAETSELTLQATDLRAGQYRFINERYNGCGQSELVVVLEQPERIVADFHVSNYLVSVGEEVQFQNLSAGASEYRWKFSDDLSESQEYAPRHTYTSEGLFEVELIAGNGRSACDASVKRNILVSSATGLGDLNASGGVGITYQGGQFELRHQSALPLTLTAYSADGKLLHRKDAAENSHTFALPSGQVALIMVEQEGRIVIAKKFVVK
ncbi:MAG TPA: PKD domain-containing protein [Luteibaculaceae bacterium]|nr:PKD domain-containing protein [Luteibaculaceae bacterium]